MPVGNALISALLGVLDAVLYFYMQLVVVGAILSWLVAFNVVNPYNRFVRAVSDFIARITEPALRQIRRVVPPMGGMDLAPLALIFIIYFLRLFIGRLGY
jgi:YggT family protein